MLGAASCLSAVANSSAARPSIWMSAVGDEAEDEPSLPGSAGNRLISSPFIPVVSQLNDAGKLCAFGLIGHADMPQGLERSSDPDWPIKHGCGHRRWRRRSGGHPPITTVLGWSEQPRAPGRRIGVHCG